MKVQTISITVPANREDVFGYIADVANIPHWAPVFCQSIERRDTCWQITTPIGKMFMALESDAQTGVIDLFVGEQLDEMMVTPIRVVTVPHGSAVVATYFQPHAMPLDVYRQQYRTLVSAMRGLLRRFGGGELHADSDAAPAFYPNLVTGKFYETWDFYSEQLGFQTLHECDSYVHLSHPSGAQFGLLKQEQDGTPSELVSGTDGRGFWLSLDVSDADVEYQRLCALGVPIVQSPVNKPWGERQFVVRDPNGVLICIAHRIPSFVEDSVEELVGA
jgi:catechol 2,3-dioxygenase-like lactoylglutathione lyase family enzyme